MQHRMSTSSFIAKSAATATDSAAAWATFATSVTAALESPSKSESPLAHLKRGAGWSSALTPRYHIL